MSRQIRARSRQIQVLNGPLAPVRTLVSLGPRNGDLTAALRVGASVAVMLPIMLWLGLPHLSMFVVFGAFAGMYGRNEARRPRLMHQAQAALLLSAGVFIGSLIAAAALDRWALIVVEGIFAGLASLFADRVQLRPAGPFFGIFAIGACASAPAPGPLWLPLGVFAASTAVTLAIGLAQQPGDTDRTGPPATDSRHGRSLSGLHAWRYTGVVAAAGAAGVVCGWGHAYWAMASSAVPLAGSDTMTQLGRGLHRMLGTLAGLGLTVPILLLGLNSAGMTAVIIALLFPTEYFMGRNYALALFFFTPLILGMTHLASPGTTTSLVPDRALQTFVGTIVGLGACLAFPALTAVRARRPHRQDSVSG